jgi:hypothetical protein
MKLLIAVPCLDLIRVEFVQCVSALEKELYRNGINFETKYIPGSLVYAARDRLAKHAVNNEFDEVLWIDSDMVFDKTLYEDLRIHGKDMICGNFISRHNPYVTCIFSSIDPIDRITDLPDDVFRVAACGFGCVLMKAEILKQVLNTHGGKAFIPEPKMGEDVAFCKRATDCGFEIWCDPMVRVGHVGNVTIWPEDGPRLRGAIKGLDGRKIE